MREDFLKLIISITPEWYDIIIKTKVYKSDDDGILTLNNRQKVSKENVLVIGE